ncbi:MAG: hypothetical protein H6718_04105 [Polyangiaceae bacterium]|nr:hypothetical protein [Polyangiaceae bacterium]
MGLDPGFDELPDHTQVSEALGDEECTHVPVDLVRLFTVEEGEEEPSVS